MGASPPTLGVRLPNSGPLATEAAIVETAVAAERLGYDTVWVHDHISWPAEQLTHFAAGSIEACDDQEPNFYESVTTVALLGGRLERVRLGIAGLVLPLRDPRVLGKQLATIERLTGSRVVVAAAIGAIEHDFRAMEVPFKRRGRLTDDHLGALQAIFGAEQPVSYESDAVTFAEATFHPVPRRLPLWVAASSEVGLKRAARVGAGWLTVYRPPADYRRLADRLDELVGDRPGFTKAYETYVCVGETREAALTKCRASLVHKFGDLDRGLEVCIVGDPDEAAEQIDAYAAAGAAHLELKFVCHDVEDMQRQMTLVAERLVVPEAARVG